MSLDPSVIEKESWEVTGAVYYKTLLAEHNSRSYEQHVCSKDSVLLFHTWVPGIELMSPACLLANQPFIKIEVTNLNKVQNHCPTAKMEKAV